MWRQIISSSMGNVTTTDTGELQEPAGDRNISPPSINFTWYNMNNVAKFHTSWGPKYTTIVKLFMKVARQVENGL
jgi:hypothetical protein